MNEVEKSMTVVMKFGGTSVGSAKAMKETAVLITESSVDLPNHAAKTVLLDTDWDSISQQHCRTGQWLAGRAPHRCRYEAGPRGRLCAAAQG